MAFGVAFHFHMQIARRAQSAHSSTSPMNFKRAMVCQKCELSGIGFEVEVSKRQNLVYFEVIFLEFNEEYEYDWNNFIKHVHRF